MSEGGRRERTKALREREEKDGGMGLDKYVNKMMLFQMSQKELEDYCIPIIEDWPMSVAVVVPPSPPQTKGTLSQCSAQEVEMGGKERKRESGKREEEWREEKSLFSFSLIHGIFLPRKKGKRKGGEN